MNWIQSALMGFVSGLAEPMPLSAEAHRGLMSRLMVAYEICGVEGPAHDCTYHAKVVVSQKNSDKMNTAEGYGRSKKDAEQQAAKVMLNILGVI